MFGKVIKDHDARVRINELTAEVEDLRMTVQIISEAMKDDPKMAKAVQDYAERKLFNERHRPKPLILSPLEV